MGQDEMKDIETSGYEVLFQFNHDCSTERSILDKSMTTSS